MFEKIFYSESKEPAEETKPGASTRGGKSSHSHRVELGFANRDAIEAVMHFLVTCSLPSGLENQVNEFNLRCICQIYLVGRLLKITSLLDQAYRTARLFMNKMHWLVFAVFDECNVSVQLLSPTYVPPSSLGELKVYALE